MNVRESASVMYSNALLSIIWQLLYLLTRRLRAIVPVEILLYESCWSDQVFGCQLFDLWGTVWPIKYLFFWPIKSFLKDNYFLFCCYCNCSIKQKWKNVWFPEHWHFQHTNLTKALLLFRKSTYKWCIYSKDWSDILLHFMCQIRVWRSKCKRHVCVMCPLSIICVAVCVVSSDHELKVI